MLVGNIDGDENEDAEVARKVIYLEHSELEPSASKPEKT